MTRPQLPWAPPLVEVAIAVAGHLLAWEKNEANGTCWAWVSCVQETDRRRAHKVVQSAPPACARQGHPAYRRVPRRVRGLDGQIREGS